MLCYYFLLVEPRGKDLVVQLGLLMTTTWDAMWVGNNNLLLNLLLIDEFSSLAFGLTVIYCLVQGLHVWYRVVSIFPLFIRVAITRLSVLVSILKATSLGKEVTY